MPKKFPEEEYAKNLPKKRVSAGVLFFNTQGELLIVKPDYRDWWLIPGGTTDEDESPLHCAIRETEEEIGLIVETVHLVGVRYGIKNGFYSDSLQFIFSGGILTDERIAQIKLQDEELETFTFAPLEKALPLLSENLRKNIPTYIKAMENKTIAYIEP